MNSILIFVVFVCLFRICNSCGDESYHHLNQRYPWTEEQLIQEVKKNLHLLENTPNAGENNTDIKTDLLWNMGGIFGKRKSFGSDLDLGLLPIDDLIDTHLNIENLTFQDGRSKAYAYVGALKALENIGLLSRMKRFAGVGTGAILAALLACHYKVEELQQLLLEILDELLLREPNKYSDYDSRMKTKMGCNPGEKLYEMLGNIFLTKYDNADLTFTELHDKNFSEICIVVSNVNAMRPEYWHRKTVPDMRVRDALYMSLSLPGMIFPKSSSKYCRTPKCVYLTGSLLCSNPIHLFDGFWLSMYPNDDFYMKMHKVSRVWSDEEKFNRPWNPQTLGFVLLNHRDKNIYPEFFERVSRMEATFEIPDTKDGRKFKELMRQRQEIVDKYHEIRNISIKLISIMNSTLLQEDLSFEDALIRELLSEECLLTPPEQRLLFKRRLTKAEDYKIAFKRIFPDQRVTATKIINYIQKLTFGILDEFTSKQTETINGFSSFVDILVQTIKMNTNKIKKNDFKRTVGIYTGHVRNNSYLEPEDQIFLFKQGWDATVAYLRQRENVDAFAIKLNAQD